MEPALATVSALEARLGIPLGTLTGADRAKAEADLEDASNLVRAETRRSWLDDNNTPNAPGAVVTIVLKAALRCYRNADEYTSETEDGYTWRREPDSVSPYLIDAEIRLLRRYAATSSKLYTLPTTRAEAGDPYYLEDQYGGDPILVHDPDYWGPW
jgi:hypothetical protein